MTQLQLLPYYTIQLAKRVERSIFPSGPPDAPNQALPHIHDSGSFRRHAADDVRIDTV